MISAKQMLSTALESGLPIRVSDRAQALQWLSAGTHCHCTDGVRVSGTPGESESGPQSAEPRSQLRKCHFSADRHSSPLNCQPIAMKRQNDLI